MNEMHETISNCYKLIQNVLQDAFNVQTAFFTPPYGDLREIDRGIRAAVWTDYNTHNTVTVFSTLHPQHRILIVKSNLGFYNIIVIFAGTSQPDFISVGPFRDNELSANYFAQILKDSHISPAEIRKIKYMYEKMPLAQVDGITNVIRHILKTFLPEFRDIVPELIQFSEQQKKPVINNELLDIYSIEYSESYKTLLFQFLEYISNGDNHKAKEALHTFLKDAALLNTRNMREYKRTLLQINDYCHTALLYTSIHPLYVLRQTQSLIQTIEEATTLSKLDQITNEICHKYCLLVKNYANPDCSRLIKDIMTYIRLHLDEELSLHLIAEHFQKNASSLSNNFSKNMGMSITAYIQQTRMETAIKLFHTTDMSISEVATAVGYHDFSYFSKCFSKYTGQSPRAYLSGTK